MKNNEWIEELSLYQCTIRFFKRFFCKHSWESNSIMIGGAGTKSKHQTYLTCKKCGKSKPFSLYYN